MINLQNQRWQNAERNFRKQKIIGFQNRFHFTYLTCHINMQMNLSFSLYLSPVFLPALLLSLLVFTGGYFSFTEATEAPPRHRWSNMSLTGVHTGLLKQPFSVLNIHRLERRKFPFPLKRGCVELGKIL